MSNFFDAFYIFLVACLFRKLMKNIASVTGLTKKPVTIPVIYHNLNSFLNKLHKDEKHQTRVSLLLELVSDAYLTANRTWDL